MSRSNAILIGPANWPAVRERCDMERWHAAYSAANGDPDAAAYIEERKAAALAQLTQDWRQQQASKQEG